MRHTHLWIIFALVVFAGCEGKFAFLGPDGQPVDPGFIDKDKEIDPETGLRICPDTTAEVAIEALLADYETKVHPLFVSTEKGCGGASCHDAESGRLMRMDADIVTSFYRIYGAGYFDPARADGAYARVSKGDMPPPADGTKWSAEEVEMMFDFSCKVDRYLETVLVPPDEDFPAELKQPYEGPDITDYDNNTLTFEQLRGRVQQQFGDDWVREGVDQFDARVRMFGGVNFDTAFVLKRTITADFLLGMQTMSEDICGRAYDNDAGPFSGLRSEISGAGDQASKEALLSQLMERILLRPPVNGAEVTEAYDMLVDLEGRVPNERDQWSAVCEALVLHPDFIFTRPPTFDTAPAEQRPRMLLIRTALDLVNRPPTDAEFTQLESGTSREELIRVWMDSQEFKDNYYHRLRILLESDGSDLGDEPARFWAHVQREGKPIKDLLVGEYGVNEAFVAVPRPDYHGKTGLLTMKGYMVGKPGLPHFNYPARVLSDFMGFVFEVPPSVVDMRETATSTVDKESVCYSCHFLLTPLAHQRLAWDDEGNYRAEEDGVTIDDTDKDMVDEYPYKGKGLEAFAVPAARKEKFIRQMANSQFNMLFGRLMRVELDERDLYWSVWQAAVNGEGTFADVMYSMLVSESYVNPVGSRPGDNNE